MVAERRVTGQFCDEVFVVGSIVRERYQLARRLARGGMGIVYIADDNLTGEEVVVKAIAPQVADEDGYARFDREAVRLARLKHPNIVRLIDYGRHGGVPYIVMEFVPGESLAEHIDRSGPLPLDSFVPIAAQVLKAVGHAHSHDVMIRDIKPENLMIYDVGERQRRIKLLDFGLARLVGGADKVTRDQLVGTPSCLSPEEIEGRPMDIRVDVYALGTLFYRLLTGRAPFVADSAAAVLYMHVNASPPALSELLPEGVTVPPALEQLIASCLEKDANLRPDDANVVVERLIDAVPGQLFRASARRSMSSGIRPRATLGGEGSTQVTNNKTEVATNFESSKTLRLRRQKSRRPAFLGLAAAFVLFGAIGVGLRLWPSEGGDERAADLVTSAETLLGEGEFVAAVAVLDNSDFEWAEFSGLEERVDAVRTGSSSGGLLADATVREAEGDFSAATEIYRRVLEGDPGNQAAVDGLVRLAGQAGAAPVEAKAADTKAADTKAADGADTRIADGANTKLADAEAQVADAEDPSTANANADELEQPAQVIEPAEAEPAPAPPKRSRSRRRARHRKATPPSAPELPAAPEPVVVQPEPSPEKVERKTYKKLDRKSGFEKIDRKPQRQSGTEPRALK